MTKVFCQGEGNIWYFGQNAGLDFNSGTPIFLSNGQLNTTEGCAVISDLSGQMLFYTDGITVWNRNHQIMSNGSGLLGHPSSSQSAIIIPKPGSSTIYYIVTTPEKANPIGARYSIVDMNLSGGLGDITSTKNVLIKTPVCEKVTAIKKANNTGYWVVFHEYGSNAFLSYSITDTGINLSPVISNVGSIIAGDVNKTLGCAKISSDGTKLVSCNVSLNTELFDFNTSSGVVSNPRIIGTASSYYGAEFSPTSNILYLTGGGFNITKLFQYDLTANNITNSEVLLVDIGGSVSEFGALQLAPDNKIYLAKLERSTLGVINSPDSYGANCNFQYDGVTLGSKRSKLGLPQFVSNVFEPYFTVDDLCFNSATVFNITSNISPNSVLWDFGDGQTSNDFNAIHQYLAPGSYNVSLTIVTSNGVYTKSRMIDITPTPIIANTITDLSICGNSNMIFNLSQFNNTLIGNQSATEFGIEYFYNYEDLQYHINPVGSSINLSQGSNLVYAKVYNLLNRNCFAFTTFTIEFYENPFANTANNLMVCDDFSNDGLGTFNLDQNTLLILGSQNPSFYQISYHLNQDDANNGTNPLSLIYQNISNPQIIYARVQTNNDNLICFSTTTFQIGLNKVPNANQPQNLFLCDDESNDGSETFNLDQQVSEILGVQSVMDYAISFHLSVNEANSGTNDLNYNFTNTINPQFIYARIENRMASSCFDVISFQLIVKPRPVVNLRDEYSICEGNSITVSAPTGFSSYSWSNGSTTPNALITTSGNYTLTAVNDYGTIACAVTKSFVVNNSNIANITQIITKDWSDNQNMITVEVSGDGNYEYSLDGLIYQDSNVFTGLESGQYTIYVNDKNGCGVADEDTFLLMYPKFFTPNGDGINDIWQIKFSFIEPNMEIILFDRYGKLIKKFMGSSFGWDGTYNGQMLFSDDYWFVVKRLDGREYKGHFTLKR